jgi:hypothetical protein
VPDLSFAVDNVCPVIHAAVPLLSFKIRIVNADLETVQTAVLDCRIEVEAPPEPLPKFTQDRLQELFGEPSGWAESTHPMPWARANAVVGPFDGSSRCELQVPCSFDFNVAATKYFYGLETSSAPLQFEFTGTCFTDRSAAPIAPSRRARFVLPMSVWSELMDTYYPDSTWLRLPRRVFQRMSQYKIENRIPTWEDVLERLLPTGQEAVH